MDDKFESEESAIGGSDAPGEEEAPGSQGGTGPSTTSGDNETTADADPPIVVQGGGKTGRIGG